MFENKNFEVNQEKKEQAKTEIHSLKKASNLSVFIYKYFRYIIFIEVLLVLILGYFFIVKKELEDINNYNEEVSWKREELKKIEDYQEDLDKFEKKYKKIEKELEDNLDKLYDIFPPERNLPNIVAQIESLVSKHNFILGSLDLGIDNRQTKEKIVPNIINKEEELDLIKEIDINIFVFSEDGGYERIKELLDAFEHHIRFMDITSFGFEEDMESYSIILKTYYLADYEEKNN